MTETSEKAPKEKVEMTPAEKKLQERKAKAKGCTTCFGEGEIMHGSIIPCPACQPDGDKKLL